MASQATPLNARELAAVVNAVLRVGQLMAKAGAAAYRMRESMTRTAHALGAERAEFSVLPESITATVSSGAEFRTQVVRVSHVGVNMRLLQTVDIYTRKLARSSDTRDCAEVLETLDALDAEGPLYPRWITVPALGLACAAFCGAIEGSMLQMIAAFFGASAGHLLRLTLMARHTPVATLVTSSALASSTVAHAAAIALSWATLSFGHAPIESTRPVLASVLFLVPGVPLVTSLLDALHFDLAASLARAAHGVLVIVCIATGMLTFFAVFGRLGS